MSTQQEKRDKLWEKMFQQLLAFKAGNGHASVPSTFKNKTLARWVSKQRENEASIVPERKKKLDAIRFYWYKDMQQLEEDIWLDKYELLKRFHKKFGHYQVPAGHALRIWVDRQRAWEDRMPAHRKALLDAIKFRWKHTVKAELSDSWNSFYKELVKYHTKFGDCLVSNHSKEYLQLGRWVLRQRKNWKKLDTRKRNRLKELNFVTSDEIEKERSLKWLTMLAILKRYKKEHGHCRVPSKYKENPELGRWVEVQRLEEKKLPDWRKEKLNASGFEWSGNLRDSKERTWYAMYDKLENFYKRFKHSSVPEYWKEDPKLSIWVMYQRRPKLPLTIEKVSLLNKLSFEWNPKAGRPRKRNESGWFVSEV